MFYQLPPVGNPLQLSSTARPDVPLQAFADAYHARFFASGTAALAAAIAVAMRLKAVDRPEVILPAYGCPDLISAAVFAGATPVLVDMETDRPWLSLEQLPEKITTNTVAIIAVNLFGIMEQREQLHSLAVQADALLIEDSAQAFPGRDEENFWRGDLVVLSFGRGKPVSLLGGGAVLYDKKNAQFGELVGLLSEDPSRAKDRRQKKYAYLLKAQLYNWMLNPRLYWLPQHLPFLHLGETRYRPLRSLEVVDRIKLSLLPANITAYRNQPMDAQKKLAAMLSELDPADTRVIDLPRVCNLAPHRRLLRYPLLISPTLRDVVYARLQKPGLGPSRMYPQALPKIAGLEALLAAQDSFPAATSFAERILTLPTHSQLKQADMEKIHRVISLI